MSETDAARWGEPEAVQRRRALASSIEKHVFKYQNIVRCGGSPPVWEVAARFEEQNEPIVFRIGGSRATELRMLAISHSLTPSCQPEDVEMGMAGVAAELPW